MICVQSNRIVVGKRSFGLVTMIMAVWKRLIKKD